MPGLNILIGSGDRPKQGPESDDDGLEGGAMEEIGQAMIDAMEEKSPAAMAAAMREAFEFFRSE